MTDKDEQFNEDDLKAIKQGIIDAQSSLDKEMLAKVKEEAKKEAEQEFQIKKEAEEKDKKIEELTKKLEETTKTSAEKLQTLTEQVDKMATSKQVINVNKDPFEKPEGDNKLNPDTMTDEEMAKIEVESGRVFFGQDKYDQMRREVGLNNK